MSFQFHTIAGVRFQTSTLLEHGAIHHGFSTRLGGVSQGVYASLNLRRHGDPPDTPEHVQENYRRFCAAVDIKPEGLVLSHQVHQDTVRHVTAPDAGKGFSLPVDYTADALVTNTPGLNLMVFSADCIILLLWDPDAECVGAVHAGWRGTALDLPAKTVGEMARLFGAKPRNIRAAIGAGIGPCCFETRDDVPDAMRAAFGSGAEAYMTRTEDRWHVDLKELNAWRLREAGVPADLIDICPLCTACRPDLYWSHRKLGENRGLQAAVIGLRAGGVVPEWRSRP